ncbi:Quinate permease [Cladobotryum mycophilum]|uniref:Quinate permease n=1 Tax=Cladobotryum mycophilum TaxID=491253 RepID=A0ABR0SCF1_9HYPO
MSRLGTWRATYLVVLSCIGSFLFAYDTGIVGGVLTLKSFQDDMGFSEKEKENVTSLSASLLQAGAFFSCLFVWPFTARFGRRWSIAVASMIFNVGAILQLFHQYGIATWYVGRTISGIGAGAATVIIPLYSAEMAPKEIRGQLGSLFQFFFSLGVAVSYWVDYGAARHFSSSSTMQWRIPVALQLVPGGILGLGTLLMRESCRWLAQRDRHEEALESLIWVRGGTDKLEVRIEFNEIVAGIEEEERVTAGVTWKEYFLPANRYRLFLAITMQIGAQLTGNTSLAYFSPQVFQLVGAGHNALLLSGFFGVCKVISCAFFLLFLVERVGRRGSLLAGSFLMGLYMFLIALLTQRYPPADEGKLTPPVIGSLTLIFLEAMTFNISWGPIPWLYMSEIFPTRIREGGVAVGAATQWLFSFTFSQITPPAVNNLGWKTFVMFCIFNWALVFYTWLFVKETKGLSLEEMEILFNAEHTQINIAAAYRGDRKRFDEETSRM